MIGPRRRRWLGGRRVSRWLRGEITPGDLVGLHPSARRELLWRAQRARAAGDLLAAQRLYELAAWLWPSDATATLGQGACLQEQGRLAEAMAAYDDVLGRDPENPHALANRAECHMRQGRRGDATADLERALAAARRRRDTQLRPRLEGLCRELAELQARSADTC